MSDDQITIEINGTALKADKGAMVIEVADRAGIRIPRFCYHRKLSVAANCRMCLVEVEKAPKPLPACATPVMDGMKVFTKSPKALAAQKATMEFLLINHPLDCPICDQGGECELQDVAMGYGGDVSRYSENKRVVADKNIGPLIATEMTRCIHCTRCVRFGQELAGVRELGATGRGEHTRIGTYIEHAVDSEMSGNVIDLCPVGALTAKPSRFSARAWEIMQHATIAAHDCVGSNLFMHTFRGKITRAVPRDNEQINECWLSDRDRFSYEGLNSSSRLTVPMVKINDVWHETDWDRALEITAKGLQQAATDSGLLVSSNATLEEMSLVRQLAAGLGTANVDHRLRQTDFREQVGLPRFPALGCRIGALEKMDAALVIGSNMRKEQPIIAHRLRKAAMRGAHMMLVNTRDFDFNFRVDEKIISPPHAVVQAVAAIAKAAVQVTGSNIPSSCRHVLENVETNDTHLAMAEHLKAADQAIVLLGTQAMMMPYLTELRVLASVIAQATGAAVGYLTEGANTSGAWLSGMLPAVGNGLDVQQMMNANLKAYLFLGIEPEADMANPGRALQALKHADFVVSMTAFVSDTMKEYANVLLPVSPFTETSGTLINIEGRAQTFAGVSRPAGESRPAWKVLRVLGNLLDLDGFEYNTSDEILREELARIGDIEMNNFMTTEQQLSLPDPVQGLIRIGGVQGYHEDAIVRRATALQKTADACDQLVRINPALATRLGLIDAKKVLVSQGGDGISMSFDLDEGIPDDCVWLSAATADSASLGDLYAPIELEAD